MIGMVNAVGATQASRAQSEERKTTNTPEPNGNHAPVLSAEQAANRVLVIAVEALEFQRTENERPVPSGEQSDAIKQAESESRSSSPVGANLDLTA